MITTPLKVTIVAPSYGAAREFAMQHGFLSGTYSTATRLNELRGQGGLFIRLVSPRWESRTLLEVCEYLSVIKFRSAVVEVLDRVS